MTAPGYGCAFDDPNPVRWLITNLANGSTVSLCEDDFPVGMIPLIAAHLGVDPGRLYEAIKRFVDREAAREAKTAAATARPAEGPDPGATAAAATIVLTPADLDDQTPGDRDDVDDQAEAEVPS